MVVGARFIKVTLLLALISATSHAQVRQEIRFYKANKLEQTSRIMFTKKKGKLVGCHNMPTKRRVYQANQIGFAACSIYRKKDCDETSIIEVNRNKDKDPATEMSQGFSWFPINEKDVRGVKVKSWKCEGEP